MKKTVSLNPGQSGTVAFTFTPSTAKVYSIKVDGLTDWLTVLDVPFVEFQVSNLVISPQQIYVGETVSISVTVTNIGNAPGSYEVVLDII